MTTDQVSRAPSGIAELHRNPDPLAGRPTSEEGEAEPRS